MWSARCCAQPSSDLVLVRSAVGIGNYDGTILDSTMQAPLGYVAGQDKEARSDASCWLESWFSLWSTLLDTKYKENRDGFSVFDRSRTLGRPRSSPQCLAKMAPGFTFSGQLVATKSNGRIRSFRQGRSIGQHRGQTFDGCALKPRNTTPTTHPRKTEFLKNSSPMPMTRVDPLPGPIGSIVRTLVYYWKHSPSHCISASDCKLPCDDEPASCANCRLRSRGH
ncbi:hypothetical protein BDW74DRAFT_80892 [Aspergillus multicolor]|uniref:uncharacterized protein n=1 Tax=Aspergillus multicolor TaxID=41759 RepID=UPI003CCCC8FA